MNAKQDGGFNLHGWKKLTKIRLLKAAEGFNPKYQQCNWLHYIFFINLKLHRLFQSPCSSFLSISSEFKSVFPLKLQENQFHFINFISSISFYQILLNQFHQINFVKSILSNQFYQINFVKSILSNQFYQINFIKSILSNQFYQNNFIFYFILSKQIYCLSYFTSSNQIHFINFILSVFFVNFILSIPFYQFHFINCILSFFVYQFYLKNSSYAL